MKTLNMFRKTNAFSITGTEVEMLLRVNQFVVNHRYSLVGVANNPKDLHEYTIRVYEPKTGNMHDILLDVHNMKVIESVCVFEVGHPL